MSSLITQPGLDVWVTASLCGRRPSGRVLRCYRGFHARVLQVIGLVMAWLYWQKLNEIYSKLDTVDFRILEMRDFRFGAVDLSGAGWCWCLPKEGGYIPVNVEEEEEEEGAVCHSKV